MEEECNLRQVFQVSEVDNYLTRREFKLASKAIIHRLLFARACDANETRDAAASDAWLEAEFRELLARRPLHGRLSNSGSCIKIAHFCSWAANLALREVSAGNTSATESKNGEAPAASEPNHSMVKQQYQDALKQNMAVRRQAGRHPVVSLPSCIISCGDMGMIHGLRSLTMHGRLRRISPQKKRHEDCFKNDRE